MSDPNTWPRLRTADDITPNIVTKIHEFVDSRWEITDSPTGERVASWEDWLDRFERYNEVDLGGTLDSPAIRKIKRVVRDYLKD